jgi:LmbE family N-acetylglucosaminyl deacetylase
MEKSMMEPNQVMVISAHPDDVEFTSAGTVAQMIKEGRKAVYVICTSGDKGTSNPELTPESLSEIREQEQLEASRVIGVSEVIFLRYPDQGLEETPSFRKEIVRIIRQYRPDVIFTSDPYRRYLWHRDHRILGQVVMDAVFPFARDRLAYPDLLENGFAPHKVKEVFFWGAEHINHRVDITETFDLKLSALACHKSQICELPITNLREWLEKRCRSMAEGEPFAMAEAFYRVVLPE